MKTCIECKQEKLNFPPKGNKCRACLRIYMKKWRDARKNDLDYQKKISDKQKAWWVKNREWGNERQRNYRKENVTFSISNALRARTKYALIGCVKQDKTFALLGCSPLEWKSYLESKFQEGMTWENYGTEWEIDHIKPIAAFDLQVTGEQFKAFHYLNTQPLWKTENRKKGAKWEE